MRAQETKFRWGWGRSEYGWVMSESRNVRMTVAYRGTDFRGFAENPGVPTVGGCLREALERILGGQIELQVAGRTDAGVHAIGQVVSFRTDSPRFDVDRLERSVNRLCGPDVVVRDLTVVADDFDARFSAVARRYEYTVSDSRHRDPLRRGLEWHVGGPLDDDAMNTAAAGFCGEHDFSSFCRRPKDRPDASLVRSVSHARWTRRPDGRLVFTIEANAFCHQMVRSLVGFCVAVGRGQRLPEETAGVLDAADRARAAPIAPPDGLVLVAVSYGVPTQV